jgi:hypothetical protein
MEVAMLSLVLAEAPFGVGSNISAAKKVLVLDFGVQKCYCYQ